VIAGMATAVIGLPIGGFLVATWGWQSVFFINVPLALVALNMTISGSPGIRRTGVQRPSVPWVRIDLAGITFFSGTMIGLLVFLMSLPDPDWVMVAVVIINLPRSLLR